MVFVQDLPRLVEIKFFFARLFPRQLQHVFEVGPYHVIIGSCLRKLFHSPKLALGFLADVLRQVGGFQPLAKLRRLRLFARLIFAKLLLNGLHLLAEDIIALRFVHLALGLGRDLRADLHDLDLAGQRCVGQCQKLVHGL
jgi:hypothetical protein